MGKVAKQIARIAVPVIVTAVTGNPALGAAAAGVTTKATGGTWGQSLIAAGGNYIGARVLGPALESTGSAMSSSIMGPETTASVWGSANNLLGESMGTAVTQAISSQTPGMMAGAYLGSTIADNISGYSADQEKKAAGKSYDTSAPAPANLGTGVGSTLAMPTSGSSGGTQTASAEPAAAPVPAGVSFFETVKNRDTGSNQYIPTAFGSNLYGRQSGWGSVVTV